MWGTVLFFAVICAVEPTRIGLAALLVALPRPFLNLLAFWIGLVISGFGLALAGLFLLRDYLPRIIHAFRFASASPVVPPIKVAFGVLAISVVAMLAARSRMRQAVPVPVPVPYGGPSGLELEKNKLRLWSPLSLPRRLPVLVKSGSVGMAFIAGLCTSAPPLEFWGAVLAILASGATGGTQVSAVVMFLLVGYAIAEIPLICYLASPSKTRSIVAQLHGWLRAHSRPISLSCLGVFGVLMIAGGVGVL